MEIDAKLDERQYALLARYVDGFAHGWSMAVPESFKDALDIKLTPRVFQKVTEMRWTQGRLYSFKIGDTLYDTPKAYQSWGEALKHVSLGVQVEYAQPSGYITYETVKTKDEDIIILSQSSGQKIKEESVNQGLLVNKQRINHGVVRFKVLRPNNDRTKLLGVEIVSCTQDEFVAFLQTGSVRTTDNKQLNLLPQTTNQ